MRWRVELVAEATDWAREATDWAREATDDGRESLLRKAAMGRHG
jgi:hypothetical protein